MKAVQIPKYVLTELADKFNLYKFKINRQGDNNKFMSTIQKSHWCCLDDYLYTITFKSYAFQMFNHLPNLKSYTTYRKFGRIYKDFIIYTRFRPSAGAIIISKDKEHILLVKSYKSGLWSFPKGKVEDVDYNSNGIGGDDDGSDSDGSNDTFNTRDDPLVSCACREVYEETSLDITNLINPKDYCELLSAPMPGKISRLYWIENVSKSGTQPFLKTNTRGEIADIKWINVETLQSRQDDPDFAIVTPFINELCRRLNKKF